MTCQRWQDQLDRLIDEDAEGALNSEEFADRAPVFIDLMDHLESCADCRRVRAQLEAVVASARELPRDVTPPRDLWGGISDRLESGSTGTGRAVTLHSHPSSFRPLLAAALVFAAIGAAVVVGLLVSDRLTGDPEPQQAKVDTVERVFGPQSVALPVATALDSARSRLSPEAVRAFETAQEQIALSRSEILAALEDDPGDVALLQRLAASHRLEARLIETLLTLPTSQPKETLL